METLALEPVDLGSTEIAERPFKIGGKNYMVRQASVRAGNRYRNARVRAAKFDADMQPVGVDNMAEVETTLVCACLFEESKFTDRNGQPQTSWIEVQAATVLAWPDHIQHALFDAIKELSPGLDGKDTIESLERQIAVLQKRLNFLKDEDDQKNSLLATTSSSS